MNYKEIRELTEWLEKSSFTTYSLSINGVSLSVAKQQGNLQSNYNQHQHNDMVHLSSFTQEIIPQNATHPSPDTMPKQETTNALESKEGHVVISPIVGVYYESTGPGNPAFVEVGQKVEKGDVLCILEAMKIMNEITSDVDGTVAEIMVSNGDMVEACMPLFRIEI